MDFELRVWAAVSEIRELTVDAVWSDYYPPAVSVDDLKAVLAAHGLWVGE